MPCRSCKLTSIGSLEVMSQPASRASSASLQGVDLAAVQANLRALGHEVDEAQLVSMLQNIDISEILGRSARGTQSSAAPDQADPLAAGTACASIAGPNDGLQRHSSSSRGSVVTTDAGNDGPNGSSSTAALTLATPQHSRSRTNGYLSDLSASSCSEPRYQDEAATEGTSRGPSSLSTSRCTRDRSHMGRRSTVSSSMTPALLSDVPEEDDSRSISSWYCDAAYSISSLASRRARRAAGRASRSSSGSGDGATDMSVANSARSTYTATYAPPQPLPAFTYQALPCRMPQTDRLAKWRHYQEGWERDPFLTAGGHCKVSKRPRENFGEFFAQEHMLLAMEREAYIKGRGTVYVDDDFTEEGAAL